MDSSSRGRSEDAALGTAPVPQPTVHIYDREISLVIDSTDDDPGIGQFRVALLVDGKERFSAYFTDKRDG